MCWSTPAVSASTCPLVCKPNVLQSVLTLFSFTSPNWQLSVLLLLEGIFISTCSVDVRWFPFDIQRCELKFGSWTFDGWLLDIQMKEADVSGYMPNGEWDLLGKRAG